MNLPRRQFLHLAAGAVTLPAISRMARGANLSDPAGALDRRICRGRPDRRVCSRSGRPVVGALGWNTGDRREPAGAGTILATTAVAKSPPDGYTLLVAAGGSFLINPAIGQKLPYDPLNDFAPISMTLAWSLVLVANKSFPADTVAQVIEEAKRTTTSLNFATPGPRDIGYLAGELLALRAGIRMQHINYNGSASALTDVIGGRVPLMFDAWQSSKPYVDGGQLKLIATTGVNRLRDAPQAPTIAETYPGFSANPFSFVLGPAGIPEPILQKLSADLRAVVDSPEFAAKMLPLGTDPKSSSPQELRLLI